MKYYSVLLVDDEEEVFQVMMKKLDWEKMGFQVAGYARNGMEALEMAEIYQPDIVMTDIKMPYMDGLTLCRKLKEMYEKVKVIIFSGFDEFEYAKEAIKIEAEEYILKPVNSDELCEVFQRVKNNLDKELDEKRNIEKLKKYYQDSLPMMKEGFYTALLDGRIPDHQIEKYMINYQVDLKGPFFTVTVLHISHSDDENAMEPVLLTVSVKNLADEHLTDFWKVKTVLYLGEIVVISQLSNPEEINRFTDHMDKFCKMAKRVCNASVTAGIGYLCSEVGQLQISYRGAQDAVSYRILYGNVRAINIAEIESQDGSDLHGEEMMIQDILKQIRLGDRDELHETVYRFTNRLSDARNSIRKYRILLMQLTAELYRVSNDNDLNLDELLGRNTDAYEMLLGLETSEELQNRLLELCLEMQKQIAGERQDNTKSFVKKAVEYVKDNFADKELSIENVCGYLNVSTAYFSTVFKKETGKTFGNYLTDYRMEKAVDLLINKEEKTYIIAEQVGYFDPNYFSYVFKKQYGISPSKYKQERINTGRSE